MVRLICLPYSGGSAAGYMSWQKYFSNEVMVKAIELKGRGNRFKEVPYENLLEAVDDIYYKVVETQNDLPYVLFGHSMGCVLIYELINKIIEKIIGYLFMLFYLGEKHLMFH